MKLNFRVKGDLKLPSDFKEKWLTALRSGDYSQTRQNLRDTSGFCCLGVGYDVLGGKWHSGTREHVTEYFCTSNDSSSMPNIYDYGREIWTVLNQDTTFNPDNNEDGNHNILNALSWHNDKGSTFDEIADWVETYL